MDTNKFFEQLDNYFANQDIDGAKQYLKEEYQRGIEAKDDVYVLTVLNETMGFCRDIGAFDESIDACHKAIDLMKKMGIEGSVEYATSLQNIANAHRAAGLTAESLEYFHKVFVIYKKELDPNDYRIASLHNNIALLYQEKGNFIMATEHLKKALSIIKTHKDSDIEVASTLTNLAASEIELDNVHSAKLHLEEALEIFRKDEKKNFHYSAALSAMAALECKNENYAQAIPYYEEALYEIELNMGRESHAYIVTEQNYQEVTKKCEELGLEVAHFDSTQTKTDQYDQATADLYDQAKTDQANSAQQNAAQAASNNSSTEQTNISGLELSRLFYEQYGKVMIHEKFGQYENEIAVGLCGEGSEVFGFDDEISRDHDFGPGFCMWLSDELYAQIGRELNAEYDKLPDEFMQTKRLTTRMAEGRVGAWSIDGFFENYTGYKSAPKTDEEWIEIDDYKLATVTNGAIFRDDRGEFTKTRQGFMRQSPLAYRIKLARVISTMAQTGQCNYARSMARKDYVTANMCIAKFMEATLHCLFLLNDSYAPYYKWMLKGSKTLEILPEVGDIMRALADTPDQRDAWKDIKYQNNIVNKDDQKAMIIEMTAKLIINELRNQGLVKTITTNFLGDYVHEIYGSENSSILAKPDRESMIREIVTLEFEAFDKVENIDGRAECQDDWPYFNVMRRSQYMTWTDAMLEKLLTLWRHNKSIGWNMITEKYARMMESTDPKRYKELESKLPPKTETDRNVVEQIAQIQVKWMEEFAQEYPLLASQARDISSENDEMYNTSYETYLKGELLTYDSELIKMYGEFVVDLSRSGKNLAELTIQNTAKLQGYKSLDEAENSLKERS